MSKGKTLMLKANEILTQNWCLYYCAVIAATDATDKTHKKQTSKQALPSDLKTTCSYKGIHTMSEYITYKKLCLIPNAAIKLKCLVSKWKAHRGFWEI